MRFLAGLLVAGALAAVIGCGEESCPIRCNDGWCSHAENRQGACSSHGGIAFVSEGASAFSPTAPTH